jgi:hypothetical protein
MGVSFEGWGVLVFVVEEALAVAERRLRTRVR